MAVLWYDFSMLQNMATLPDDKEELKKLILDLDQRYRLQIEFLEERLRILEHELFGRKSEKRRPQQDEERQLHLFNEAEAIVCEKPKESVIVSEHTRQKTKRKPLPSYLPRVDVIHDIDEKDKLCGCGEKLCRIGEEAMKSSILYRQRYR